MTKTYFYKIIYKLKINQYMFKIFKDKDRVFKCTVDVFGANIDECKARLIFEYNDQVIMYKGSIDNNGQCKVIIPKVKGFNEGESGKVTLEVIADNTLFESWSSNFEVAFDKKVNIVFENSDNSDNPKQDTKNNIDEELNSKRVSVIIEDDTEEATDRVIEKNITVEEEKVVEKNITVEEEKVSKTIENDNLKNNEESKKRNESSKYIDENVMDFDAFLKK
jgi:ABC-type dipeptide/oligopeptide/nickel transport system ATPase subunit